MVTGTATATDRQAGSEEGEGPAGSSYSHAPVLRFLFDNPVSRFSTLLGVSLIVTLIPYAVWATTSSIEGNLFVAGDGIGFVDDVANTVGMVTVTLLVLLTKALLKYARTTFDELEDSIDTSRVPHAQYVRIRDDMWEIVQGNGAYRMGRLWMVAVGAAYWAWSTASHWWELGYDEGTELWLFGDNTASFVTRTVWEFFTFVLLAPVLLWTVVGLIHAMNQFFKRVGVDRFRLRAISPDGAAGLGSMGKLALRLELIFLPLMALSIVYYFQIGITAAFLMLFPTLILILVIAFFYPLWSAHNTMEEAKHRTLQTMEHAFNRHYDKLLRDLGDGEVALHEGTAKTWMENVREIKYLYEETEKMPVWPFDFTTLRRFSATIVIPVLVVLIPEIVLNL